LEAITITDKNRGRLNQLFINAKESPALTRFVDHLKKINPKYDLCLQLTHSGELSKTQFSKRLQ